MFPYVNLDAHFNDGFDEEYGDECDTTGSAHDEDCVGSRINGLYGIARARALKNRRRSVKRVNQKSAG